MTSGLRVFTGAPVPPFALVPHPSHLCPSPSRATEERTFGEVRFWPFASVVKVRFGAARVDRLLSADEINNRIGDERPEGEVAGRQITARKRTSTDVHHVGANALVGRASRGRT